MNKKLLFSFIAVFLNLLSFSQIPLDGFIDQVTDCSTGCTDLTINFTGIQETTDYTVESIPFNPPSSFNGLSNQLFANTDDLWGNVVGLPFNFNFFGNDYNQLVVGANGVITFDTSLANTMNLWQFTEPLPNNTNQALADANIFGAGHDIDPAASLGTHEIAYQFFGEAPFRYMVISFFNVAHFSCNDLKTTQMIVLYETLNVVEVYLQDKPLCDTWNSGSAVVGIQNDEGTVAVTPPGRNTGVWTAQNEAWRFLPAGNTIAATYSWFDVNSSLVSNDVSINVCPTDTETYTAEVEFNNTFGDPITITDSVTIQTTFVGASPEDIIICSDTENSIFDLTPQTNVITGGNTCSIVTYHESLADADSNVNAITQLESYTNTINPQTIYVRVEDANIGSYNTDSFSLVVNLIPEAFISEIETCSNGLAAGIADFDLSELDLLVTNGNANNDVVYYFELEDANNETNPLPTLFTMTNPNEGTIHARVTDPVTGCFTIVQCYLNVNYGPGLEAVTLQFCETEFDGFATFDLVEQTSQILNGQNATLTFFENEADADNNVNPIANPEAYINIENPQGVIVRGDDSQGCYSISVVELFVHEIPTATTPTPLLGCDYIDVNGGYGYDQFDLSSKDAEILGGLDPINFSVDYYETLADAQFGTNTVMSPYVNTVAYNQTLYARVFNNDYQDCNEIVELDLVVEYCPIECDSQPVNVSICNVFNYLFHFEHQDYDTPLTIVFNSGFVTNQELIVIDSDGSTNLNEATPYGNGGDLTGLTFTSTNGLIGVILSDNYFCDSTGVPLDFDVYCTSDVGLIEINAFTDENSNLIFDTTESLFSNGYFTYEVNNDGIINTVDSSSGSFVITNTDESNSYDISYNFYEEYQDCFDVTVPSFQDVTVANGSTVVYDFPVVQEQACDDLGVYLIPITSPRPGFYYENELVIVNNGITDITSGTIEFVMDPLVTFDAVVNNPSSHIITPTTTGFTLDFNNLQSGEESYVTIVLYCPTSLNIDDLVTNTATYTTTTNDIITENNTSVLTQTVIGSYDPNDKTESRGREIVITDFTTDDYLFYTIRFQNIGTAEAINIRIEDVLDSQLDFSSLRMLRSSHNYVLTQTNDQLTWQFDNVNLPSESQDEPNSHGYVHFKIKPIVGYSVGDIIPNTASIYFDFNEPIITNTFQTEFVQTLSASDFNQLWFSMYPNPAKGEVNISFSNISNELVSVNIMDIQGKIVIDSENTINNSKINVNVSSLSSGIYFMEINLNSVKEIRKLIIE